MEPSSSTYRGGFCRSHRQCRCGSHGAWAWSVIRLVKFEVVGIPVEREVITGCNFDCIMSLDVAHDITAQIDGGQVFDWGVVVATFAWSSIVCWNADALECTLINALNIDSLSVLVRST